jgi:hypothetical protein
LQHNCKNQIIKFMKKLLSMATLGLLVSVSSCSKDDEESTNDRKAPVIEAAEGRDAIRPQHGEVRSANTDHMHVRFRVRDESGVQQALVDIHHAFDGHSHGKTNGTFEPLSYRKIYEVGGATSFNIDSNFDDVYWGGSASVVSDNVLAGPYDFSIDASDIHGNQTSAGAGNNYLVTFYIERPYAPLVSITNLEDGELEGEKNEPLDVQGSIAKTAHSLSSDIAFVWVRLVEEDDHHHKTKDGEIYEEKWGTSQWRNMTGKVLPSTTQIDLAQLLSGADEIRLPNEHGHFELIIWVEDVEGNVVQKKYEVHVD